VENKYREWETLVERDKMLRGRQGALGRELVNEGLYTVHCDALYALSMQSSQPNLPRFLFLVVLENMEDPFDYQRRSK
jgi:hypothetical protein